MRASSDHLGTGPGDSAKSASRRGAVSTNSCAIRSDIGPSQFAVTAPSGGGSLSARYVSEPGPKAPPPRAIVSRRALPACRVHLSALRGCNPAANVLVFDSGMLARREAIMAEHRRLSGHTDERKMAVMETISSVLQRKGNQVWQVSPEATVFEAIAEMADKGVGALPVVLNNELVGIISERDYARKVILQGRSSQHTLVREIMTPSPITVTPEFTVNQCLVIMTTGRVRYLPVMDGGGLAGIISIGDLVHAIIATQAFTIDQLQTYISADYPA